MTSHLPLPRPLAPPRAPDMRSALRGEFWLTRHRPTPWVAMAIWAGCLAVFAYLVNYLVLGNPEWTTGSLDPAETYATLLPSAVGYYPLASMPMYGAPQFAILGAILGASDYGRGTLRTLLPRFTSRTPVIAARLVTMVVLALVTALVTTGTGLAGSLAVAAATGLDSTVPGPGDLAVSVGIGWLVAWAFLTLGFAVGTLLRSVLVAIVALAAWILGVESLLIGMTASMSPVILGIQGVLPVGAASSVIASRVPDGVTIVPALAAPTGPWVAVAVLAGWIAVSSFASVWSFTRRDIE